MFLIVYDPQTSKMKRPSLSWSIAPQKERIRDYTAPPLPCFLVPLRSKHFP